MNRLNITAPVRGSVRLGVGGRRTVYAIASGVWASGMLWLVFHYFMRRTTEFGFEAHPLEAWWLRLHGAFAFAGLWLVGFLSARHIVNGWASRRRRLSGVAMLAATGLLVLSGYLLYYLSGDGPRSLVSIGHWGLGLAAPGLFLWHRFALARRHARAPTQGDADRLARAAAEASAEGRQP